GAGVHLPVGHGGVALAGGPVTEGGVEGEHAGGAAAVALALERTLALVRGRVQAFAPGCAVAADAYREFPALAPWLIRCGALVVAQGAGGGVPVGGGHHHQLVGTGCRGRQRRQHGGAGQQQRGHGQQAQERVQAGAGAAGLGRGRLQEASRCWMRSRLMLSWRCRSGLAWHSSTNRKSSRYCSEERYSSWATCGAGSCADTTRVASACARSGLAVCRVIDTTLPSQAWNWRLSWHSCGSWPNSENSSSTSPGRAAERLAIIRIGSAWCTVSTPSSDRRMANSRANRPSSPRPQTNTLP